MTRELASSSTPKERGTGKGGRRAYQRPALEPYGDIRALTAFHRKEWGPGDFFIFFHTRSSGGPADPTGLS